MIVSMQQAKKRWLSIVTYNWSNDVCSGIDAFILESYVWKLNNN